MTNFWSSATHPNAVGDVVRHTYDHSTGRRTVTGTVDRIDRGHALVDFGPEGFAYIKLAELEVVAPAEMECTTTHGSILSGRAYAIEASFGAFIAALPVGAEIVSVSGWVARWTGEYAMTPDGHRAAVLERIRNTDGRTGSGTFTILACAMNMWNTTGRYSVADGAVIDVRHDRGTVTARCTAHGDVGLPRSFRDYTARTVAHDEAAEHARQHPPIDVKGWRTWPTERLEAALDRIDDSTALWDAMSDEIAERDHEHRTRVNNGGILP